MQSFRSEWWFELFDSIFEHEKGRIYSNLSNKAKNIQKVLYNVILEAFLVILSHYNLFAASSVHSNDWFLLQFSTIAIELINTSNSEH